MEYFGDIFGNENIISFFTSAKERGSLAHAYIIEGDRGSGKTTLARQICAMLANADKELKNKIVSSICPDIMEYGLPEKKKFIPVETVRTVKKEAYIKPSELDIKAFIIKDAHMLTAAGQNALLKLLEEPPSGVYFFLLCQNAATLLPTVRSRAPTVRMQRFSSESLMEYLNQNPSKAEKIDSSALPSLCKKADGSIGSLLELIENNSKNKNNDSTDKIMMFLKDGDFSGLLCAVQVLPQDRKQLEIALSELATRVRDMIASYSGSGLFISSDDKTCKELMGHMTIKNLTLVYQAVEEAQNGLNMNMNVQIIKTSLAKHMMRAAK